MCLLSGGPSLPAIVMAIVLGFGAARWAFDSRFESGVQYLISSNRLFLDGCRPVVPYCRKRSLRLTFCRKLADFGICHARVHDAPDLDQFLADAMVPAVSRIMIDSRQPMHQLWLPETVECLSMPEQWAFCGYAGSSKTPLITLLQQSCAIHNGLYSSQSCKQLDHPGGIPVSCQVQEFHGQRLIGERRLRAAKKTLGCARYLG